MPDQLPNSFLKSKDCAMLQILWVLHLANALSPSIAKLDLQLNVSIDGHEKVSKLTEDDDFYSNASRQHALWTAATHT